MLTILTRDESFHVPLNVHFLKQVLARQNRTSADLHLRIVHKLLFATLTALPIASRPKAGAFDGLGTKQLAQAYAENLSLLFLEEPELGLPPPRFVLWLVGLSFNELKERAKTTETASAAAADRSQDRYQVAVQAL